MRIHLAGRGLTHPPGTTTRNLGQVAALAALQEAFVEEEVRVVSGRVGVGDNPAALVSRR